MSKRKTCAVAGCGKIAHDHGNNTPGTYCSYHHKNRSKIQKPLECDNVKGYLGYFCTSTITDKSQIDTDHWDGDRTNNSPENIKYLCKNCHAYKTVLFKDHLNRYSKEGKTSSKKNDWSLLPVLHKERQQRIKSENDLFTSLFEVGE